jgi:hypothetical protein
MKTDTEIRIEGTEALIRTIGELAAERYIALIQRESSFDYTKWQKKLWSEKTIEQISGEAMISRKEEGIPQ